MSPTQLAQLLALSLIGGFGFIFMRVGVEHFPPLWMVELRLLIAIPILFCVMRLRRVPLAFDEHWRSYLVLGFFSLAAPFLIFSWAAKSLYATMLNVINATSPLVGSLVGLLWLKARPTPLQVFGMLTGLGGIAMLAAGGESTGSTATVAAVAITQIGVLCFGIGATYANACRDKANPLQITTGSVLVSALLLLPLLPFSDPPQTPTLYTAGSILCLGVLNTTANYLLFYSIAQSAGPVAALTVNYLIPVVGITAAVLLLREPLPPSLLSAAALAICGTLLTTNAWRPLLQRLRRR